MTTLTITQTGPGAWDLYSVVKSLIEATGGIDTSNTGTGTRLTWDLSAVPGSADIVADGTGLTLDATTGVITAGTVTGLQIAFASGGRVTFTGANLNAANAHNTVPHGTVALMSSPVYDYSARQYLPAVLAPFTGVDFAGGSNNDTIRGSDFDDTLGGAAGDDSINGFDGNDWFLVGAGKSTIDGGNGSDVIDFAGNATAIELTLSKDVPAVIKIGGVVSGTVANVETIIGGSKDDKLTGDGNANVLLGMDGKDLLDGGGGTDTANYSNQSKAVAVTLNTSKWATVKLDGVADDKLRYIESVVGAAKADKLIGDSRSNSFSGLAGNDTLSGGSGNDTLTGGTGNDSLVGSTGKDIITGGAGKDVLTGGKNGDQFFFREHAGSSSKADVVTDFTYGEDLIVLDGSVFRGLGPAHRITPGHLFLSPGPTHPGTGAALIYNPGNGRLYYDDDGKGGHAAELVLTFSHKLTYFDFGAFYLL